MNLLPDVLHGDRKAGIYRIHSTVNAGDLTAWQQPNEVQCFYVDGATIHQKADFLDRMSQVMKFPEYFGANWDAFEDCLTDLSWCPAKQYVVVYTQPEQLAQTDPEAWATAIEIFQAAVEYWASVEVHMLILLNSESFLLRSFDVLS